MADVVVIGAGVIGSSVAWHLARRGLSVDVLESGRPGAGTSGTSFAMDITPRKTPRHYFDLARLAAHRHVDLERRLGGPSWRHPAPAVEWGLTERDHDVMLQRHHRLRDWDYPSDIVDTDELRLLAPELRIPDEPHGPAVVYRQACWYDAPLFVRRLLDDGQDHGLRVHTGVAVTGLHTQGGVITGVETPRGLWQADVVVNCAGPAAGDIAAMAGVTLPVRTLHGVIGYLDPVPGLHLESVWTLWSINLRPLSGGGTCLHSYVVDAELPADAENVPPEAADRLRTFAEPLLGQVAHSAALHTRIGNRPVPDDGLPLVGTTSGAPNLYTVSTHSGVHLAPILGQLAAAEIDNGESGLELAPYRPDRTADGTGTQPVDDSLREMLRT